MNAHLLVFQPKLDILGMVIYATEFMLWCGVFACAGYFNLMPWMRKKASQRSTRRQQEADLTVTERVSQGAGESNDISLQGIPSSTSVFRTPSSLLSARSSSHSMQRTP